MNDLHVFSDGTTMVIAKDENDAITILTSIPDYEIKDYIEKFPDGQEILVLEKLENPIRTITIPDGAEYKGNDGTFRSWMASTIKWVLYNSRGYLGLE